MISPEELTRLEWKTVPNYHNRTVTMRRMEARCTALAGIWAFGLDPGRNFGVSLIQNQEIQIWWGQLPRENHLWMYGVAAYNVCMEYFSKMRFSRAIVEGAAYHAKWGQVGLAEVRFGFYLALLHAGRSVDIVPPATCRKLAFGSAKIKGYELMPTLNHNAADAVGCALAAISTS